MNVQQINSTGLQLWVVVVTALVLVLSALILWRVTERVRKALDVFYGSDFEIKTEREERCFRPGDMYNIDKAKTIMELIYFDGDWDRVKNNCYFRLERMAYKEYGLYIRAQDLQ